MLQYLSRSRFWKNVLALVPELTEKKLPKKSLLQIIPPSDSPITVKSSKYYSTTLELLPISSKTHWPPVFDPDLPAAAMGSIETSSTAVKPTTLKEFESVFPQLVEDLSTHCKGYGLPEDALKWFQEV